LVTALIKGDKEIGVTALFADEEYDKGKIIAVSKSNISYPIKIAQAIEIISNNYVELVTSITEKIVYGKEIYDIEQNEDVAYYSLWR